MPKASIEAFGGGEFQAAAGHEEVALRVEEAQVAGAEPAVGGEHTGGGLGVAVVAPHDPGVGHADLALHARLQLFVGINELSYVGEG